MTSQIRINKPSMVGSTDVFNDVLHSLFGDTTPKFGHNIRTDIVENENGFVISMDIPGFPAENIDITVESGELLISGKFEQIKNDDRKTYIRRERSQSSFNKWVSIPNGADLSKAEATIADGVLHVSLPKTEAAMTKKIMINKK